jgi:beta-lactam-binding protein with PASTA domain
MRQMVRSSDRQGAGQILRASGRIVLCLLYLWAPGGQTATAAAQVDTAKHPAGSTPELSYPPIKGDVTIKDPRPSGGPRVTPRLDILKKIIRPGVLQSPDVKVPNLSGRTVEEARRMAKSAGLKLAVNEFQETEAPRYRVSRQTPEAGKEVKTGSWIRVDTEAWARVPDVTGGPLGEGLAAIWSAGLVPRETGRVPGDAREERIKSQEPDAGEWVPPETVVTFLVEIPASKTGIRVPDIEGRTRTEAEALLGKLGLRLVEGELLDGDDQVERIVRQRPPAKTLVEVGSSVRADIAVPLPQMPVPNIVGETVESAAAIVKAKGFSFKALGGSRMAPATDRIVSQEPPAGAMRPLGSMVAGEIEPPPVPTRKPLVTVPDLLGLELVPARDRLAALGLLLRPAEPRAETRPDDRVTAQDPVGGARVTPGTTVSVTLKAAPVPVPDVVGENRETARHLILNAALSFRPKGDLETAGKVVRVERQEPEAGALVPRGTTVVVELGAVLISVPEVIGMTRGGAARIVRDAGFQFTATGDLETADQFTKVKSQDPVAGTQVPRGTLVIVEVGPVLVTVPDVTSLTRSAAAKALASSGLRVDPLGEMDAAGATVDSQRPSAGTSMPRGSAVSIVLLAGQTWLWWAAAGAAALLLVLLALRFALRSWIPVPPARVTVRPVADHGVQEIEVEETPGRGPYIRLRPRLDPGEQILLLDEDDDGETKELRYG